jgi:hypothetical protein
MRVAMTAMASRTAMAWPTRVFDLGVSGAGEVAEQLVADAPGPAADGCVRA